MNPIPIDHALIVAAILFVLGAVGVMVRRNLLYMLMSLEIMLNAAGVAFIAAAYKWGQPDGQTVVIFILVTAASEVAVGLPLLLRIYHYYRSVDADEVSLMKG